MTAHLVKEALRRRDNGDERKHQALGYKTPSQIFAADQPVGMWTTQESALPNPHRLNNNRKKETQFMKEKW